MVSRSEIFDLVPELQSRLGVKEFLSMADIASNDLEKLINLLKHRTSFYQDEIAKMECTFVKLKLLDDRLEMFDECVELEEKLSQLQEKFDTKELTASSLVLSYTDKMRKHNGYAAKLKMCIKLYVNLNKTLTEKIEELKSEYVQSQKKISTIVMTTTEEMKKMEKRISLCEHELSKLEKKHPWLKNPAYNLPEISKEINLLIAVRKEKEDLVKELSCYHGLKPNLQEASEQLAQIRNEFHEINKKMLHKKY